MHFDDNTLGKTHQRQLATDQQSVVTFSEVTEEETHPRVDWQGQDEGYEERRKRQLRWNIKSNERRQETDGGGERTEEVYGGLYEIPELLFLQVENIVILYNVFRDKGR